MTDITHVTIYERLGHVEAKLDVVLKDMPEREVRIRALEQWKARVTGIAAGVAAVAATFGAVVATIAHKAGLV